MNKGKQVTSIGEMAFYPDCSGPEGNYTNVNGVTAKEACCGCGGGSTSNVSACTPVRYEVHVSPQNWLDAEAACVASGGYLASIHSQADQDTVYNLIAGAGLLSAWIGYNDRDAEVGCTHDHHPGLGNLI